MPLRIRWLSTSVLFTLLAACGGGSTPVGTSTKPILYVPDLTTSQIDGYALDEKANTLTALTGSPFAADYRPIALLSDPNTDHIYAANAGDVSVTTYTYDSAGALTKISTHALPAPPEQMLMRPDGSGFYVLMPGQIASLNIDSTSHDVTVASIVTLRGGVTPSRMSMSRDGSLLVAADPNGYISAASVTSGTISELNGSPFAIADHPADVACCAGGNLYVVDESSSALVQYGIAVQSGGATLTRGASLTTDFAPSLVLLPPNANYVLVASYGHNTLTQYALDSSSYSPTSQTAQLTIGTGPQCMFTDSAGTYVFTTELATVHAFTFTSNVLTAVNSASTASAAYCGALVTVH